jgi:hypothetical protein
VGRGAISTLFKQPVFELFRSSHGHLATPFFIVILAVPSNLIFRGIWSRSGSVQNLGMGSSETHGIP